MKLWESYYGITGGKKLLHKKRCFCHEKGEIWTLTNQGYQAYYGERNFRFINSDKDIRFIVLRDAADTDMEIYWHLELYFEEIK